MQKTGAQQRRIPKFAPLAALLLVCAVAACLVGFNTSDMDEKLVWEKSIEHLESKDSSTVSQSTFDMTDSGASNPESVKIDCLYNATASKITTDGYTFYYETDGANAYLYSMDQLGNWNKAQVEYSKDYFYPSSAIERLKKIGAYIDDGSLTYNEEESRYSGDSFSSSYAFGDVERTPLKIEAQLTDGTITYLYEEFTYTDSDGNTHTEIDTMRFYDFGKTVVDLPQEGDNPYSTLIEKASSLSSVASTIDSLSSSVNSLATAASTLSTFAEQLEELSVYQTQINAIFQALHRIQDLDPEKLAQAQEIIERIGQSADLDKILLMLEKIDVLMQNYEKVQTILNFLTDDRLSEFLDWILEIISTDEDASTALLDSGLTEEEISEIADDINALASAVDSTSQSDSNAQE